MVQLPIRDAQGRENGTLELSEDVFAAPVNVPVMHRVVRAQLAAARTGTHSTKTRGDVRGGGRKPWRQKGTGRARQGSTRAPQWTGGGVVFGPHPRDHSLRVNKKEKVAALRAALTDRVQGGNLFVVEDLTWEAPKTSAAVAMLRGLGCVGTRVVLVVDELQEAVVKSFRNLPRVRLLTSGQLNTYDVLQSDVVVMTRGAVEAVHVRAARPARGSASAAAVIDGGGSA